MSLSALIDTLLEITVNEDDAQFVADYGRRAFVTNISFDYCMAQNDQDCGNTEPNADLKAMKIRQNGGNSNYEFGLVVLILENGKSEELNLQRSTGNRFEYAM